MSYQGLLRHLRILNSWDPDHFTAFYFRGQRYGYLKAPMCEALRQWPDYFSFTQDRVELNGCLDSFKARSAALAEVTTALVAQGVVSHAHGERYPVTSSGRETAIATIDRTAAPYFGLRAYGQHLNGFVRGVDGLQLWIARRAADRRVFPNRLDNMVAGGLPHNLTLEENLRKECMEEACVPAELAASACPVGVLSYCTETAVGLKPDTLYCYDLELPPDFRPSNSDGEVAEFMRLPVEEVVALVRDSDEFKLNCNLVLIDFFIRHGILNPETPGYLELSLGLREKL
jgi:8-oxo-dGTP pyrophosphatase MutT (NUDIX family)